VETAPILAALAEGIGGGTKELRKEARRGLHRLQALGIEAPRLSAPAAIPAVRPVDQAAVVAEARITLADGVGSRALWLRADRPPGGVYAVALVINDIVGMKAASIEQTTRRRADERQERWEQRTGLGWIAIPPEYARRLVGEALELNRESGFTVPREWLMRQRDLRDLPLPFERAIVYDEISAGEIALNPQYLERSPQLLDEEELKGWFFGFDQVRSFALELRQARQSPIVLSPDLQSQRQQRIIASAIDAVAPPPVRRGLARRLEEAAYYFLRTERPRQARQALAAARRLAEGATTQHPLLVAMVERSLELATQAETAGLPVELVRRSPYDPID
jgi:GNAT superfamily N-acetyltransferase